MAVSPNPFSRVFNALLPERKRRLTEKMFALASEDGDFEAWMRLKPLLVKGADAGAVNGNGDTLLNVLCARGNVVGVIEVLNSGKGAGVANKEGMTPFLTAARAGIPEIVQAFIERGANIRECNLQNENALHILMGYVPAHIEKIQGHEQMRCAALKVLLDAGMALDHSMKMRLFHYRQHLLPAVPGLALVHQLHHALDGGGPLLARGLIKGGVHPDSPAEFGCKTALATAAALGFGSLMDDALAAGANINLPSGGERLTPLQCAAINGKRNMFKWLIDLGADPNAPCPRYDKRPLLHLARDHSPEMLKFVAGVLHALEGDSVELKNNLRKMKPLRLKLAEGMT